MRRSIDFTDPDWEQKYKDSFDQEDDYFDELQSDKKSQLWLPASYSAEQDNNSATKRIMSEINSIARTELYNPLPKVRVQHAYEDPRTGMSVTLGSTLVEGGAEILETPQIAPYLTMKHASLNSLEQTPINEWNTTEILSPYNQQNAPAQQMLSPALSQLSGIPQSMQTQRQPAQQQPIAQQPIDYQTSRRPQQQQQQNGSQAHSNYDNLLRELGFDFISVVPSAPTIQIKMCFSGPVRFSVPIPCHKIIVTDQMVIVVVDNRNQTAIDMDFGIDNINVKTDILMPDMRKIPVITVTQGELSFDLGPLRCFLFFRRNEVTDEMPTPSPAQSPAPTVAPTATPTVISPQTTPTQEEQV
jgi:hypothetical protein